MKTCSKCKETKELTEFYKHKNCKDGIHSSCKTCDNEKKKKYIEDNKENVIIRKRTYYQSNKDKFKQYAKKRDRIKLKEQRRLHYLSNKNRIKLNQKLYRDKNKDRIKEYQKSYRDKNKDMYKEKSKEYYSLNNKTIKKRTSEYIYKRKSVDHIFKLKCNVRTIICNALNKKGYSKISRTHEILGCSFEDLKIHIERQFIKGMTWDNRDKWHIDHIIPMATAKTEEDVIRLNHYTNLRPLWAEENLSKSDKIITHQLVLL